MGHPIENDVVEWIGRILPGAEDGTILHGSGYLGGSRPAVAVVVAHPDDESVGLGGHLPSLRNASFLFVTDGAPRNMADAAAAGFDSREAYAGAREAERRAVFGLVGIDEARVRRLEMVDQEAVFDLAALSRSVAEFIRPADVAITHPYEGGHPDHDACAFAVRAACELIARDGGRAPAIVEMASYHSQGGRMVVGEFLPDGGEGIASFPLSPAQQDFKRRLFDCYRTQRRMLQHLPVEIERFRLAPAYDFALPPHEGLPLYELFGFEMTGAEWRRLAGNAAAELASGHAGPPHSSMMDASPEVQV